MFREQEGQLHFGNQSATELVQEFGSPLYLYDEKTLRESCRKIKGICDLPNFRIYYSAKANSNLSLLKIIREEGLMVDAMSLGEIAQERAAGFEPDQILFLSNNVSERDFQAVIDQGINHVCLDSIDQIETYCALKPDSEITVRINPGQGKGAGHHEKVITAGKVKFGVDLPQLDQAFTKAQEYGCRITGFMLHIGSLFLEAEPYLAAIEQMLELAEGYPEIAYVDFGGGIGIPYDRSKERPFPFGSFSVALNQLLSDWMERTKREPIFAMEPGRFVVAESGVCLTEVQAVKENAGVKFVGTDLGFNFLLRPEFYQAYHEIRHATNLEEATETYHVVGNVCESGDNLGKSRKLPPTTKGDVLMVRDTGAYGFAMASNYNSMGRPAEVLIQEDGKARLIRRRETTEDLLRNQVV